MSLRDLPSVERALSTTPAQALRERYGHDWVVGMVRDCVEEARLSVRNGAAAPSVDEIAALLEEKARRLVESHPRRVINATGVIIHTNLGRAPLSREATEAMTGVAQGYSSLELDLDSGRRGSRQDRLQAILRRLTGAEAALAVNNNAAALLLGLSAIAAGREVIVSRGEAVEIGGGFRIPDVLAQSGATLVEVGTTNRTYASDYEAAISENTAALLKVHSSNFRVTGFTHSPGTGELVELGRRRGVPILHDVGSGCLLDTRLYGLSSEPRPQDSVRAGAGLVFFSTDKLLGGPQGGVIVGSEALVGRLSRHPLARAVRIDKMSLAALTATLLHYVKREAPRMIPIWRMISASPHEIGERAARWREAIGGDAEVSPVKSTVGGGSLPGETLDSWAVVIPGAGISQGARGIARRLREQDPPVIARIEDERVVLDPRTVLPEEEDAVVKSVREAVL